MSEWNVHTFVGFFEPITSPQSLNHWVPPSLRQYLHNNMTAHCICIGIVFAVVAAVALSARDGSLNTVESHPTASDPQRRGRHHHHRCRRHRLRSGFYLLYISRLRNWFGAYICACNRNAMTIGNVFSRRIAECAHNVRRRCWLAGYLCQLWKHTTRHCLAIVIGIHSHTLRKDNIIRIMAIHVFHMRWSSSWCSQRLSRNVEQCGSSSLVCKCTYADVWPMGALRFFDHTFACAICNLLQIIAIYPFAGYAGRDPWP